MRSVDYIPYKHSNDITVSFKRYALLHGWARWLTRLPDIEDQKKKLIRLRGTNWGVVVHDDILALEYQRLDFYSHRALYAVGMFGLSGKSTFTENGWIHASKAEIKEDNKSSLRKYRDKAHKAKKKLNSIGLLHCETCHDDGFIMEGDEGYTCPDCHIEGIVKVEDRVRVE